MVVEGGCVRDFEECDCSCHRGGFSGIHNIPCCGVCRWCQKKRIKFSLLENHEEHCDAGAGMFRPLD